MKPIPCYLYIFPDDVDATTANPDDCISKLYMPSINASYRYAKEHNIKQFVVWEIQVRYTH